MTPISGPFSRTQSFTGRPNMYGFKPIEYECSQTWWRQKPPYDRPLTYTMSKYEVTQRLYKGNIRDSGYTQVRQAGEYHTAHGAIALNKCYGKLVDQVADYTQWANNLLEARKTLGVATQRIEQLVTFARRLKKFDFVGAAKVFGHAKPPRKVSRAQGFGKNWLEYHFMWEPAIKDIEGGMKALTRDFSPVKVKARATHSNSWKDGPHYNADRSNGDWTSGTDESKAQMVAWVRIVNPNASLATELGLVNLGSILWEAVPFSFVADWFGNVGQVLSSATDFVGKQLSFSSTTVYQVRISNASAYGYLQYGLDLPYWGPWTSNNGARSIFVKRTLGITGPTLAMKPFKGFSVVRGATAVALLLQFLPKK
jgi:hypothetical protein